MTDKQTDDNENIDDVDAPGEAEETRNLTLEDAEDELDHDALAKLAEESVSGADPDDMDEADVEARDEGVVPEATKDDAKPDENKDAATDDGAATADKGEQPAGDTKDDKQETKAGEDTKIDGVLTKDGKHVIPYGAHTALRDRVQTAETKAQQLERENAELKERLEKGTPVGDDTDQGAKLSEDQQSQLDTINAQIGKIEEEYGEELAAPLKASLEMQKNALLDNARLRQELETTRQQTPTDTDDEAQAVQAAIDASPVMATWQARGDDWYKRSVEVYNTAMANDPDFAALSREEQFQELPNRVQALYGKDKSLVSEAKPDEKPAAKPEPKDDKPADKAATDFTGTISDIPGGTPPDSAKYGPVDGMSPQAIQAYMDEQAEKGTLEDYANAIA